MATRKIPFVFFVLVLGLVFQLAALVAQEYPDPDALLAREQQCWKQVEKARKALVRRPRESAGEFAQRVQAYEWTDEPAVVEWRYALDSLESADFVVPPEKLRWTIQQSDEANDSLTFVVSSSDPAVPYKGPVGYKADGSHAFESVLSAIKAKALRFQLHFRIDRRPTGEYRVHSLRLSCGTSEYLSEFFLVNLDKAWKFSPSTRTKPQAVALIPMVAVAGGTFTMGDSSGTGEDDEKPPHRVALRAFRIGETEVTLAQWLIVMGQLPAPQYNPNQNHNDQDASWRRDYPANYVSWFDALEFCNKLSKREGLRAAYVIDGTTVTLDPTANGYRLPTEAQWEYAAKGGPRQQDKTFRYAGSNTLLDVSVKGTYPVARKMPNGLGLYDMTGSVREWCWDWYGSYSDSSLTDPAGAVSGPGRVFRGGCDIGYDDELRVSYRDCFWPDTRSVHLGFRVVLP